MKYNSFLHIALIIQLLVFAGCSGHNQVSEPVDLVNNQIGNISILLVPTFPTTGLPNAMLRMNPEHYEHTTDRMEGIPLNVPSHRQGSVLMFMPSTGSDSEVKADMQYRYDHEKTSPYFYSVFFDDYGIDLSFAPSSKSAVISCVFENDGTRHLALKAKYGEIHSKGNILEGYETYHGTPHYFYLEFDQEPSDIVFKDTANGVLADTQFDSDIQKISLRYGVSYISTDQARRNLEEEINTFDIESVKEKARQAWNRALGKIRIEGGSQDQQTVFYTSLYRTYERMINISEDGRYYSAFDRKVHDDGGVSYWTDDWSWDTYHALHPLHLLLNPRDEEEKITSYLRMWEASGWVPTFPTVYGDAHCMNGDHAAVIMADAVQKGLSVDAEKAFEAMDKTVRTESVIPWYRGNITVLDTFYEENGWFPALKEGEIETVEEARGFEKRQAVAVTLAASYDDWCISLLAKAAGKDDEAEYRIKRSLNYRNLWNYETGFFHPKDSEGKFIEPFDYIFSGGLGNRDYYDENNAWTYIWDVHHNIGDLKEMLGGAEAMSAKLDELFTTPLGMSKWQYHARIPDATGGVGQYVMGNEPSFHIPYLYNYCGEPWKTQKRIRMLLESWFRNDLMGIPGDEDGGGMSAFYVFSAMGFYPVTAGLPMYVIGSPLFDRIEMDIDGGKTFTVIAHNNSDDNKYIQSAKLNGQSYDRSYILHSDIINGGTLEFEMGPRPSGWASGSIPPSGIEVSETQEIIK